MESSQNPFTYLRELTNTRKLITKLQLDASQTLLWSGALWLTECTAIISMSENPSSFFIVHTCWQSCLDYNLCHAPS
jgi:hypothetical protein